jgi:ATP-dependent exoDNAse (exonuclease V) alpha subunit
MRIAAASYARVVSADPEQNLLTVETQSQQRVTYDPRRLHGVSLYCEREQAFAPGDRLQFTAPDKTIGVANRELATIESVSEKGELTIRLEKGGKVKFRAAAHAHFDHGYAMTSRSAQGITADCVLINADVNAHPNLVNSRFAYDAISPARNEAMIYTNDSAAIEAKFGNEISKSAALASTPALEPDWACGLAITL